MAKRAIQEDFSQLEKYSEWIKSAGWDVRYVNIGRIIPLEKTLPSA
ncbi:hypothetical protein [Pirellula sp. SH-Sr6A]|nr:hypothetical protein [Pirellula sp. SH-Sr6A]